MVNISVHNVVKTLVWGLVVWLLGLPILVMVFFNSVYIYEKYIKSSDLYYSDDEGIYFFVEGSYQKSISD